MRAIAMTLLLAACAAPETEINYGEPPIETSYSFAQNQAYGDAERQVLDIFFDESASEPLPLVIYIHGGAFVVGEKEYLYDENSMVLVESLLDQGVAVANFSYRLMDEIETVGVHKSLYDTAHALQYLRYYAKTFNIDPDRIAIYGHSAGAGAAMWLGAHDDLADKTSDDPVRRMSTRISGFAALETQATYDIQRWVDDVFLEYNLDVLGAAALFGLEQMLQNFYGLESLDDFDNPDIVAYREDVDLMGLMDASDPPMFVRNQMSDLVAPWEDISRFDLFHHPFHAREAIDAGKAAGMDVVGYVPKMDIEDPSGITLEEFLLDVLEP